MDGSDYFKGVRPNIIYFELTRAHIIDLFSLQTSWVFALFEEVRCRDLICLSNDDILFVNIGAFIKFLKIAGVVQVYFGQKNIFNVNAKR